jgi:hypothetical protein
MVRYLTMNGKSNSDGLNDPFALRYRRVNGKFYEIIDVSKPNGATYFVPARLLLQV